MDPSTEDSDDELAPELRPRPFPIGRHTSGSWNELFPAADGASKAVENGSFAPSQRIFPGPEFSTGHGGPVPTGGAPVCLDRDLYWGGTVERGGPSRDTQATRDWSHRGTGLDYGLVAGDSMEGIVHSGAQALTIGRHGPAATNERQPENHVHGRAPFFGSLQQSPFLLVEELPPPPPPPHSLPQYVPPRGPYANPHASTQVGPHPLENTQALSHAARPAARDNALRFTPEVHNNMQVFARHAPPLRGRTNIVAPLSPSFSEHARIIPSGLFAELGCACVIPSGHPAESGRTSTITSSLSAETRRTHVIPSGHPAESGRAGTITSSLSAETRRTHVIPSGHPAESGRAGTITSSLSAETRRTRVIPSGHPAESGHVPSNIYPPLLRAPNPQLAIPPRGPAPDDRLEAWYTAEFQEYEDSSDQEYGGVGQEHAANVRELCSHDLNALREASVRPRTDQAKSKRKHHSISRDAADQNIDLTVDDEPLPSNVEIQPNVKRAASQRGAKAGKHVKVETRSKELKATGKGSRSGKNRREGGGSDDDIAELDDDEVEKARLKEPKREHWLESDRLKLISYVVDERNWASFQKNQAQMLSKAAMELFPNKSYEQCRRQWSRNWELYKACRRREGHTGGKDGDECSDASDGDISEGHTKKCIKTEDGKGKAVVGQHSKETLDRFERSKLYKLINAVAHNHPEILRMFKIGSHDDEIRSTSVSSTKKAVASDTAGALFGTVVDLMKVRHEQAAAIRQRELELQERHEKREANLERLHAEREAEQFQRQREREDAEDTLKKWQLVDKWSNSPNKVLRMKADALAAELAAKEGINIVSDEV
ncbi:hypothetical protein B0H21DRAFT_842192 [Amylocystis lapponica]|nr:hypothetical protein B0H21DRAFT_842192 [Amylocystis lapponica]